MSDTLPGFEPDPSSGVGAQEKREPSSTGGTKVHRVIPDQSISVTYYEGEEPAGQSTHIRDTKPLPGSDAEREKHGDKPYDF